mgnify:CR=1 FL=1
MTSKTAPLEGTSASARERLIDAALTLFNSRGYAATTVREICEAAGVTKPVLYYHFRNKEGIYLHVMNEGFLDFASTITRALDRQGTATERLHGLLQDTYALFLRHVPEARLMHAMYYGPPQGAPAYDFDRYHQNFEDAVRGVLEEGAAAGEFRLGPLDVMTWVVLGCMNTAIELRLCHPERAIDGPDLAKMVDIVLAGLAGPLRRPVARRTGRAAARPPKRRGSRGPSKRASR